MLEFITASAASYASFTAESLPSISLLLSPIVLVKSLTALSRFVCTLSIAAFKSESAFSLDVFSFAMLSSSSPSLFCNAVMFELITASAASYALVKSSIACDNAVLSAFAAIDVFKVDTAFSRFVCTLSIAAFKSESAFSLDVFSFAMLSSSSSSLLCNAVMLEFITASAASYASFTAESLPSISLLLSPIVLVKSLTALSRFVCTLSIAAFKSESAFSLDVFSFAMLSSSSPSLFCNAVMFELITASAASYALVKSSIACDNAVLSAFAAIDVFKVDTALSRFVCTSFILAFNSLFASSIFFSRAATAAASSPSVA